MTSRDGHAQHGLFVALVALAACVSDSSVGTSGRPKVAPPSVAPPQSGSGAPATAPVMVPVTAPAMTAAAPVKQPPPRTVTFTGEAFGRLGRSHAIVGDLDRDGVHDIVLAGTSPARSTVQLPQPIVYVFHGRAAFPEHISVLQADAILRDSTQAAGKLFASDADVVQTLGDINGDGHDDFAVLGLGWFRVLLGSQVRLRGTTPLTNVSPADLLVDGPNTQPAVYGIGDVNHDELDDMLVVATAGNTSRELRATIVSGHANPWTAEALMPPATLGTGPFSPGAQAISARAAGDMDGDGFADMLITVVKPDASTQLVFYGGAGKLAGTLTAEQADARLHATANPIADVDGDGRSELTWPQDGKLHLRYGTRARLAGEAALVADLSLHAEPAVAGSALRLTAGDFDGDGKQDLIAADPAEARAGAYSGTVYALRGGATRAVGDLELTDAQVILSGKTRGAAAGGQAADADQLGYGVSSGADATADRIHDVLVGAPTRVDGDEAGGAVVLIRGRATPPY